MCSLGCTDEDVKWLAQLRIVPKTCTIVCGVLQQRASSRFGVEMTFRHSLELYYGNRRRLGIIHIKLCNVMGILFDSSPVQLLEFLPCWLVNSFGLIWVRLVHQYTAFRFTCTGFCASVFLPVPWFGRPIIALAKFQPRTRCWLNLDTERDPQDQHCGCWWVSFQFVFFI